MAEDTNTLSLEQQKALARARARVKVQAQETPRSAPGSEPPSVGPYAPAFMGNPIQSLSKLGGFGAVPFMLLEGMRQGGEAIDRGAYEVGGNVTDIATSVGAPPNVAASAGLTANVGTSLAAGLVGGKALEKAINPVGRYFMQSALKPNAASIRSGDADRAVNYLLDKSEFVTQPGAARLMDKVDEIGKRIQTTISGKGQTVPRALVEQEIIKEMSGAYGKQLPSPAKNTDVDAMRAVLDEVRTKLPDHIPVELAQEIKTATYQVLAGKYGELANAAEQAQKAGARGLRIGIEQQFPQVVALNKESGAAQTAAELAGYRASINQNRQVGGLSWLSPNVLQATGMELTRSSPFTSFLAHQLYGPHGLPRYTGLFGGAAAGASTSLPEGEAGKRMQELEFQRMQDEIKGRF